MYSSSDLFCLSAGYAFFLLICRTPDQSITRYFPDQSPQWEATNLEDLDQPFLGGEIVGRSRYYTVSFHPEHEWTIDAGAIHGISIQMPPLSLFSFESAHECIGTATIKAILPHIAQVELHGIEAPKPDLMFKAIASPAFSPIAVSLKGDSIGLEQLRKVANTIDFFQEQTPAEFYINAQQNQYQLVRSSDRYSVQCSIPGYTVESATQVLRQLEQISRWTAIAQLTHAESRISSEAIKLELLQDETICSGDQVRLRYWQTGAGEWKPPIFRVRLTNTSQESLYCALLNLNDRYAIEIGFFEAGGVWLHPGEEAWALSGKRLCSSISQDLLQQGITKSTDILKLIISTAEFDSTLLAQKSISTAPIRSRNAFCLPELSDDWTTQQITVITERPITP